jgi:LysM repeat protein
MSDEIEIERREKFRPSPGENPDPLFGDKKKMILLGAGVLAAVVILLFLAFSGRDPSAQALAQIEQKLGALEQKMTALEKTQEDLAGGPLRSLAERVELLEKRPVEKVKPPPPAKIQAPAKTQAPAPSRYHEVKKGETLFAIAKRYGLAVEELRRINNLSPKAGLAVGQKLVVSRGGKG